MNDKTKAALQQQDHVANAGKVIEQEPIAHMYPWDLERFQNEETFAQAFSIPVGCPDGRTVPLYTIQPNVIQAAKEMRDVAVKMAIEWSNARLDDHGGNALRNYAAALAALPIPGERK